MSKHDGHCAPLRFEFHDDAGPDTAASVIYTEPMEVDSFELTSIVENAEVVAIISVDPRRDRAPMRPLTDWEPFPDALTTYLRQADQGAALFDHQAVYYTYRLGLVT